MHKTKRLLCAFLAFAMIFTMLPLQALAEETESIEDKQGTANFSAHVEGAAEVYTGEEFSTTIELTVDEETKILQPDVAGDDGNWSTVYDMDNPDSWDNPVIYMVGPIQGECVVTACRPGQGQVLYTWTDESGTERTYTFHFTVTEPEPEGLSFTITPKISDVLVAYTANTGDGWTELIEIKDSNAPIVFENFVNFPGDSSDVVFFVKPKDNFLVLGMGASGMNQLVPTLGPYPSNTYDGIQERAAQADAAGYQACFGFGRTWRPEDFNDEATPGSGLKAADFTLTGRQPSMGLDVTSDPKSDIAPHDILHLTVKITPQRQIDGATLQIDGIDLSSLTVNGHQPSNIVETRDDDGNLIVTANYEATFEDCLSGNIQVAAEAAVTYSYSLSASQASVVSDAVIDMEKSVDCSITPKEGVVYGFTFEPTDVTPNGIPNVPTDPKTYLPGENVTLQTMDTTEVKDDISDGTWKFQGWYVNDKKVEDSVEMPDGSLYIEGKWKFEPNYHNVTYEYEEKGPSEEPPEDNTSYKKGDSVTWQKPAEWPGHVFQGWEYTDEAGEKQLWKPGEEFTMPGKDVTFIGKYTERTDLGYTVNYWWGEDRLDQVIDNGKLGDKIPVNAVPEGYAFKEKNGPEKIGANSGENVVDVYCYKNVTVTVAPQETTYNGQVQSIPSTYTVNVPADNGQELKDVFDLGTPVGYGLDAKTYEDEIGFAESPVGKTDEAGLYIIQSVNSGDLTVNKLAVTVTAPQDKSVDYGQELPVLEAEVSPEIAQLPHDFTEAVSDRFEMMWEGDLSQIGEHIIYFQVGDTEVKEEEKFDEYFDNYIVTFRPGRLTVKPLEFKIEALGGTWTYDGQPHGDVEVTSSLGMAGVTLLYSKDGEIYTEKAPEITEVRENGQTFYVKASKDRYADVIAEYTLTVQPRPVTLTSGSGEKTYDKQPLTNKNELEVSGMGFVGEEGVICKVTGTQTNAGESSNTFTYKEKEGTDLRNYAIKTVMGTLRVNPATVTITADPAQMKYGEKVPTFTAKADGLVKGDEKVEFKYSVNRAEGQDGRDAGTYTIIPSGDTQQGNYTLVFVENTLTINPKPITVTAKSEKIGYGEELPVPTILKDNKLHDQLVFWDRETPLEELIGETKLEIQLPDEGDLVGQHPIVFQDEDGQRGNYLVTFVDGTLTVDPPEEGTFDYVTKTHEGEDFAAGEPIPFTITVQNIYDEPVTVTIEEKPGVYFGNGASTITAEIAAGATEEIAASYIVTEEDIRNQKFVNELTYKLEVDNKVIRGKATDEVPLTPRPALGVEKVADRTTAAPGDTIRYTITVTNQGNLTLSNIQVEDSMGELLNAEDFDGTLAPGKSYEFHYEYTVTEADLGERIENIAKATASNPMGGDALEAQDSATVQVDTAQPRLAVEKRILNPQDSWRHGETIRYEILVTNTGNTTLRDLVLTDTMVNASGEVDFTDTGIGALTQGVPTLDELAPKGTWTVLCQYVVAEADGLAEAEGDRTMVNRASVTAGDGTTANDETPGSLAERLYTLTVRYLNTDGESIADDHVERLYAGEGYSVTTPAVPGYIIPEGSEVRNGTMPADDRTLVVVYADIPEPEPEPDPDPAEPGPGPAPEPEEEPDPAEELEEIPDEEPPLAPGTYLENPEDHSLTPIDEEETPLANTDLGGHTCCIMHFLLMLAAMIVYGFYTKSRKKHQARIFELKRKLAMKEQGKDPEQP